MREMLTKFESETENEFIARCYRHKLELGYTNIELANKINEILGTTYGESTIRGRGQYFNEGYGLGFEKALVDREEDSLLKELEEKKLEIQKERIKLQATKSEYNKNLRFESRQELLYENIKNAKDRLPLPEFEEIELSNNDSEYLLAWADLHYGADFVSENNSYSRAECKARFERLIQKVKILCLKNNITTLNISSCGDDLQGLLRISDVKLNDIPVVESVVEISRLIATVLNEISKFTNVKYYHTMASNHTQTRPITGKADLISEDLEVIIGNYIKDLVSDNIRIEVELAKKDYHSIELAGQKILILHGHQVKGVKSAIKDYSMLHRTFYDIGIMGHLHGGQSMSIGEGNGNTEIHIVPSFVGSCKYSDSLKVGSKAMAKLYKIEEGLGITENYTIVLN